MGGVPLLDEKEPEPDIHEETGSLLSTEDIEILESFDEGTAAYFGKMLDWLENFIKSGVEEGRFSEKQAHQDLQIALWYAFACLNLDDYIHYYRAAEWMKDSEKNATGCATWYYRYSVALMYCGRLEEALEYAERGALEEPDYRNEMEYKMEHDADALLKKMAGISFVVNPTRQNAITRGTLAEEEFTGDMDDAAWHLESIQEKGLPVNEINAYNHMAIYLRWCIEHDLMSAEFMERYWEQVQPFMADLSRADLRGFIRDQLKGQLFGALFNKEGAAFAGYY